MSEKDVNSQSLLCIRPGAGDLPPLRRILVIGASGQVGRAISELYGSNNVIGTFNLHGDPGMLHLSLDNSGLETENFKYLVESIRPEIAFLCAGFTWVDGYELEEEKAIEVNEP